MTNLDRLRAKPSRLDLTVPGESEPSTYLTIVGSYSHKYIQAAQAVVEKSDDLQSMTDIINAKADMLSTVVVGWDEDTFGEFSTESAIEVLADETLSWIVDALEVAVTETARFFTKPTTKRKRVRKSKN